jgi:dihydroorotate dehydrogenase
MMWKVLRKLLFLMPAEFTHEISKVGMRVMVRVLRLKAITKPNPIGLAAGFDKNCEVLDLLPHLGFGSAEIGTVTPKPQGGNDRPRLFRNPSQGTLFNRMGFNNLGATLVSDRLRAIKPKLPPSFVVGVNLGKNKTTSDTDAALDYAKVARAFIDCADYFVINVSSPNTPGLRALQTPEALSTIVKAVQQEVQNGGRKTPIWVKLAPEMTGNDLKAVIETLETLKIDGFVLTNTLGGDSIYRGRTLSGGYSGKVLTKISFDRLVEAKGYTSLPIISVGGIMTVEDAIQRLNAGAHAIQLYTGWVYQGPFFARTILKALLVSGTVPE